MELINNINLTKSFNFDINDVEEITSLEIKESDLGLVLFIKPFIYNFENKLDIYDANIKALLIEYLAGQTIPNRVTYLERLKDLLIDKHLKYYNSVDFFNQGVINLSYINNKDDLTDTQSLLNLNFDLSNMNLNSDIFNTKSPVYNKLVEQVTTKILEVCNSYTDILIENFYTPQEFTMGLVTTDSNGDELDEEDYYINYNLVNLQADSDYEFDSSIYHLLIKQLLESVFVPLINNSFIDNVFNIDISYFVKMILPVLNETSNEWLLLIKQELFNYLSDDGVFGTDLYDSIIQTVLSVLSTISSDMFRVLFNDGISVNGSTVKLKYEYLQEGIQNLMLNEFDVNSVVEFYNSLEDAT